MDEELPLFLPCPPVPLPLKKGKKEKRYSGTWYEKANGFPGGDKHQKARHEVNKVLRQPSATGRGLEVRSER